MFEARERMRVAIVAQKRIQNPPLTFEVKEGEWLLLPRKEY
jgi:hypothetical protein